ncbi:YdeI/OmpD-associated family protein [Dyadobacter chenwenxiniae]|uniref:YdeI/OmpD-associated family protein n=1 Tax=Dyadobacter chenwenxiniae TaxID=2906456 RepID=A0A9X1TG72_9BACT|nr:YdeI/OmpD-associated family protein [Dyadobacter chenwenxiniae]MCF0065186.1 YdeI/OmpD-associated family protein [Dyadobacter chenwenxiniae]UON84545.1 YdeI/OmpD-associated family protein [Dyadobacter chenwenxiniae]
METKNDIKAFYAPSRKEWREWLSQNSQTEKSVWLIIYHKNSKTPSVYYPESIEEALCFGWIDSKSVKRDAESSYLMFTPRKVSGKWSAVNKERVERLTAAGLMTPQGQALIDLAKETGTWEALVDAENAVIPPDLQELLDKNEAALKNFLAFPPSAKRLILTWISDAKRPETRQQRVTMTAEKAAENVRVKV